MSWSESRPASPALPPSTRCPIPLTIFLLEADYFTTTPTQHKFTPFQPPTPAAGGQHKVRQPPGLALIDLSPRSKSHPLPPAPSTCLNQSQVFATLSLGGGGSRWEIAVAQWEGWVFTAMPQSGDAVLVP